jgi:ABC-type sugar transport system ATPase subunit
MISSEILELLGVCDRILVLFRGRIAATLDAATATEESVAAAAVGIAAEAA